MPCICWHFLGLPVNQACVSRGVPVFLKTRFWGSSNFETVLYRGSKVLECPGSLVTSKKVCKDAYIAKGIYEC